VVNTPTLLRSSASVSSTGPKAAPGRPPIMSCAPKVRVASRAWCINVQRSAPIDQLCFV